MAGVASGSSENEERGFIPESIQVYKSLPVLWDVKSKEYNNRQREGERRCIPIPMPRRKRTERNQKL